jgi:hypothetical protein
MGTWSTVLAIAAFAWRTSAISRLSLVEGVWLAYGWLSYIVPELSPSKPPPDEVRYILPLLPVLAYSLALTLVKGKPDAQRFTYTSRPHTLPARARRLAFIAAVAAVGLCTAQSTYASIRLVTEMGNDTRTRARQLIDANHYKVAYGLLTGESQRPDIALRGYSADIDSLRRVGYTHLALSSFEYDRYMFASNLPHASSETRLRRDKYAALLARPHIDIKPVYKSFGFGNPTIVLIDLQQHTSE